jgi:hypothetical protein
MVSDICLPHPGIAARSARSARRSSSSLAPSLGRRHSKSPSLTGSCYPLRAGLRFRCRFCIGSFVGCALKKRDGGFGGVEGLRGKRVKKQAGVAFTERQSEIIHSSPQRFPNQRRCHGMRHSARRPVNGPERPTANPGAMLDTTNHKGLDYTLLCTYIAAELSTWFLAFPGRR